MIGSRMDPSSSSAADLAHVVSVLGTAAFSRALHDYLRLNVSTSLLFAYAIQPGQDEVIHLLTETRSARLRRKAKDAARTYAKEDFRKDRTLDDLTTGLNVKFQQAGDFNDPRFRERYFDNFGTNQEISMIESDGPELLYVGICSQEFSAEEQDYMRLQAPLILALMRKHRELVEATSAIADRPDELEQIRTLLLEHPSGLTEREAEICVLVSRGYTSEAIGLNLGISTHTVATHRKKAYAKLRISSKVELFAKIYVPKNMTYGIVN